MGYQYLLPKNKEQSEDIIAKLILEGRAKRNPQSIRWWVANFYLQGIREFSSLDYTSGTVSISYLNESGLVNLRYEEIVAKYQSQLGRLMSLDLSPFVDKKGVSLDGMRKSSIAQVVLDAAIPQDKVKKLELDLMPPLLMYGTVGVGIWMEDKDSQGIEVIMPWELLPIPIDISGPTDVRGLIRIRFVPVEWIKNLNITPKGNKAYSGMDDIKVPAGNMPIDIDSNGSGLTTATATGGGFYIKSNSGNWKGSGGKKVKDEHDVPVTQLIEIWTETSDGYLAEYRIYAGMTKLKELARFDHTASKYHMPIRTIRDVTIGSFWGRSYVDQLIPLNNKIEEALSSIFESVADFDLYGLQLWPATLGTPPEALRGQDGIKRIVYEPDYTSPDLKPENIMPAKMTNPQLQALNVASEMMDKIANQPSSLMSGEAPGRSDSAKGFGFLYETSSIPLSPTAKSIACGLSGVYRALLRILKDSWDDKKVVNITSLDDSLAGIVLDSESWTLSLSQNAIPFPDEVSVTIASEVPISKEQEKMEIKEALAENRITLDEFNWTVRKKGLNLPVGDEVSWQNYRRAMLENIQLFADGQTPGDNVKVAPNDLHRVHLIVLQAFVARPEFFAASANVRNKFYTHIDEHKAAMGQMPDQLPYIEDIAAASLGQPVQPEF